MIELSRAEARAISVAAQGLHIRTPQSADPAQVLDALGCIQLDTINVVRRSHELVLLSRGIDSEQAARFLQPSEPVAFEYWAHAASLVPVAAWPFMAFRRRYLLAHGWRGPKVDPAACQYVRERVAELGEITITELGGARGNGWERDSPAKWAAEWLLTTGELACVKRRGWRRVYQETAAVLPSELLDAEPTDQDCVDGLVHIALKALGVATAEDVADYFRLNKETVSQHLNSLDKVETIRVEGWPQQAWALPEALALPVPDAAACTPLSPFDSLVWHRPRTRRLFGVDYPLEAYKPAAARECGYFGLLVLTGTEIAGRVAVRSSKGVTRLEGHQLNPGHDLRSLHHAIHAAASWARSTTIDAPGLCPTGCDYLEST